MSRAPKIPLREYFALLRAYLLPQRWLVVLMSVSLLSSIALALVGPQIVRFFLDAAQAKRPESELLLAAGAFIATSFAQQALQVLASYAATRVGWTATNALRADVAEHCLKLDMGFHKSRTPGELIERVDGDVSTLSAFFSNLTVDLIGNALLLVGVLVVMWLEDWRVGLSLTAFSAVTVVVFGAVRGLATPFWKQDRERAAQFFGFVGETLQAREDLRALGANPWAQAGYTRRWQAWYPPRRLGSVYGVSMWTVFIWAFAVGEALVFGVGSALFFQQAISLGTVYLIFQYTNLLAEPLEQIRTQLEQLQRADAGISRINELMHTKSALEDGAGAPWTPGKALGVRFDGVSFAYPPDAPRSGDDQPTQPSSPESTNEFVLEDVSFTLEPGRVLGLLGRTGSGKTTVARLLMRFYDPQLGAVRLDHSDLRAATLAQVRSHVTLVTQQIELFSGSVRDNLTFFDESVSDERLWDALERVGLKTWAHGLERGLDTTIQAGALSAGESQLLAFARVFLRDPGVIVLDEASSKLDPATEALLERAMTELLKGRTAIIIAHRLKTIERADDILILERGRVVEAGSRLALLANKNSRFVELRRKGLEEVLA
jgi:ATP-binding cassette subfamily B protein